MSFWKWRMLPLLLALSTMADATNPTASDSSSCPAGPFKLHTFRTPNVTNEPDRPYFIVLCDLSTTVRLDPLMHPDAPQCHSHMHSVFGSNRFGPTVSLQDSILGENELVSPGGYYYSPVATFSLLCTSFMLTCACTFRWLVTMTQANTSCHIPGDGSMYWVRTT